ncbi:reticulon-3-like, partial [Sinocyclocheilus anshuiensis]|uniref:reticulon-3-like n=1 Tax=Sinocyclocheilus anshuiensis TaxID=1608454 RepID=UPI0007BA0E64
MLGSVLVSVGAVVLRGVWVFSGRANWVDPCSCDRALMEKDVTVPPETFRKHVDACLTHVNRVLKQMSRLFLVQDLVDSLKLAVVMWLMTYVGAVFNGITILILADILLFSVPPIYEKNKVRSRSFSCKLCTVCSKKAFIVGVLIIII